MKKRNASSDLTRFLIGAGFVLVAVIVVELSSPAVPRSTIDLEAEPLLPEDLDQVRYSPVPLVHFSEVLTRPLFYENRRLPPEPVATAPEEPPEEPLLLSLEGVAIVNDSRIALLRDEHGNDLIQLAEGMSHNGWVLESVAPGTAAFRRGPDTTRLELATSESTPRRRIRR